MTLSRLALTRRGRLLTLAAGIALWAVAWPVFVPIVAVAMGCDILDSRKAMKQ